MINFKEYFLNEVYIASATSPWYKQQRFNVFINPDSQDIKEACLQNDEDITDDSEIGDKELKHISYDLRGLYDIDSKKFYVFSSRSLHDPTISALLNKGEFEDTSDIVLLYLTYMPSMSESQFVLLQVSHDGYQGQTIRTPSGLNVLFNNLVNDKNFTKYFTPHAIHQFKQANKLG